MFTTGHAWSCDIALHFKYDEYNRPLPLANVKKLPFGETILDKSRVELALRRAQAAILNPSRSMNEFLSMSESDLDVFRRVDSSKHGIIKFSRNTICVTIHDPSGANLCFLDLPGIPIY